MMKRETMPEEVLRSKPRDPQATRGAFETFRSYVEMAATGCDRDNALIQRARHGRAAAQAAMQDCPVRYGYKNGGSQPNH